MKYKNILIYELIFLIFTIITKFCILKSYFDYIICAFFIISVIVLYKMLGFRKKTTRVKRDVIEITIIVLMFYILFTYLSGLILGFLRNVYTFSLSTILDNALPLLVIIVCEELIRYMIACKDKTSLIVLTILYGIFDFVYYFNGNTVSSIYLKFVFITATFMPMFSRHIISSYLSYKVSYIPGLIIRIYFGLSAILLPIFPDLGNFLISVLGVLIPYIIYYITSKMIIKAEKERIPKLNKKLYYVYVPIICFLLFIVALTSGIFKYHMIAIMSGSMEPVFYRGDAIIYEKTKDINEIKKGTAIVFKHDKKYITHRIVSIEKKDNEYIIQTKGDNNPNNDNYTITLNDVQGVIKCRFKWIGYPTVWFSELAN